MSNTPFDKRNRLFDCFGQALGLFSGVRAAEDFLNTGRDFLKKRAIVVEWGAGGKEKCGVVCVKWGAGFSGCLGTCLQPPTRSPLTHSGCVAVNRFWANGQRLRQPENGFQAALDG